MKRITSKERSHTNLRKICPRRTRYCLNGRPPVTRSGRDYRALSEACCLFDSRSLNPYEISPPNSSLREPLQQTAARPQTERCPFIGFSKQSSPHPATPPNVYIRATTFCCSCSMGSASTAADLDGSAIARKRGRCA